MSWEIKKLSECCASIADGDHQAPPKADSGIPFVTISNINSTNQFDFTNTMFVPQAYYDSLDSKRKAQKGDVLYSVVGSFGIPVYMRETVPFVFQRHIAILRPNDVILPQFLYYTMLSRDFYMMADAAALGAAQRTVSLTALRNMKIAVPPMDVQKKIVDILSAYDDLIANNQKQITLLEEAAQRLYKEWFVDLRFPGHETTPITDGIPQGWEERNIDDVFSVQYGKMLPTSLLVPNGEYPVYGANGVIGYYTKANCIDYVTLITSRGNGSGDVLRTHHKASFVTNNSFVVLPKETYGHFELPFAYHLMKTLDFKSICTGSAQPQLTNKSISMLNVIVPTPAVVKAFCNIANPMFAKIELLYKQIQAAAEARDRLLPKLDRKSVVWERV